MAEIIIAALGCPSTLSISVYNTVKSAKSLFIQTKAHPSSKWVQDEALAFEDMDDLYENCEDFDELNSCIAKRLVQAAKNTDVVFAVTGRGAGSSLLKAITTAAKKESINISQLSSGGCFEAAKNALPTDTELSNILLTEANALDFEINTNIPLCIEEIDTPIRASEVKLKLSEYYPDEFQVHFCYMTEMGEYKCRTIPLFETDRQGVEEYHAATLLVVPKVPFESLTTYSLDDLIYVVDRLRGKNGCPWDIKQTHETLRSTLIEESYEVLDAIDREDVDAMCEELGDLLLQIVFHAALEKEKREFNMRDVTTGIVSKLIYRHPHVFAAVNVDSVDEVLKNWEQLKKAEKKFATQTQVLQAVPRCFPALLRSYKVQKKAADVGFDWDNALDALKKVNEESDELLSAIENNTNIDEELGDLLFSCVNVSRLLKKDPELILGQASDKFISRFGKMETMILKDGREIRDMSLNELDNYWEMSKS
ncbi:MAG: nucleoside triphosphate pyrophosphohydrolase [Clostridia bacterium]|nr:nucleoside triphosphate pyrophosphohydrolase [Clostridia bacterium]